MQRLWLALLTALLLSAGCDDETTTPPPPDLSDHEVQAGDGDGGLDEVEVGEDGLDLLPDESDLPDESLPEVDVQELDEVEAEAELEAVDLRPEQPEYTSPLRIRVMAANTTSGNLQSYDPGHGIRIFQGLAPDIVLIQEFNYGNNTPAAIRTMVDTTFEPIYEYHRGRGQIPNGIISRFPIVESGYWPSPETTNRDFDWAIIDIPGDTDLLAVSVHLHTDNHNRELDDLANAIRNKIAGRDLYVVLGGDFNTSNRNATEDEFDGLLQVGDPYPADEDGVEGTSASRGSPYDWVLVDEDFAAFEQVVSIAGTDYPGGLVFDSRVFSPLSAVSPVQEGDSDAPFMQHMAVVRDFLLVF